MKKSEMVNNYEKGIKDFIARRLSILREKLPDAKEDAFYSTKVFFSNDQISALFDEENEYDEVDFYGDKKVPYNTDGKTYLYVEDNSYGNKIESQIVKVTPNYSITISAIYPGEKAKGFDAYVVCKDSDGVYSYRNSTDTMYFFSNESIMKGAQKYNMTVEQLTNGLLNGILYDIPYQTVIANKKIDSNDENFIEEIQQFVTRGLEPYNNEQVRL